MVMSSSDLSKPSGYTCWTCNGAGCSQCGWSRSIVSLVSKVALCGLLFTNTAVAQDDWKAYASIGATYLVEPSDRLLMDRDEGGHPLKSHWEFGWETKDGHRVFLFHESSYFSGPPFNHKPEISSNRIGYSYKFGGFK